MTANREAVAPQDRWLLDMGLSPRDIELTRAFEQALAAEAIVKKWKRKRADFSKGKVNK